MTIEQKKELEIILSDSSRKSLLKLISWIDLACGKDLSIESLPWQTLGRAVVALGYLHSKKSEHVRIDSTTMAAEIYAIEPTEETHLKLAIAATASYPFGPGDGCYCVEETGYGSDRGSGCFSGSGCLFFSGIEPKEAMQAISAELLPWLKDEGDPLAERWANF